MKKLFLYKNFSKTLYLWFFSSALYHKNPILLLYQHNINYISLQKCKINSRQTHPPQKNSSLSCSFQGIMKTSQKYMLQKMYTLAVKLLHFSVSTKLSIFFPSSFYSLRLNPLESVPLGNFNWSVKSPGCEIVKGTKERVLEEKIV
jgi:hypothetical protein